MTHLTFLSFFVKKKLFAKFLIYHIFMIIVSEPISKGLVDY
jgi:hypothetical protein